MRRLVWCTDVHLDSTDERGFDRLCAEVRGTGAEGLLLTGDISIGPMVVSHLRALEDRVDMPVYFVAGNHDYYGTSVARGRKALCDLTLNSERLKYLPTVQHVPLTQDTALVGHDGWYDCQNGDIDATDFVMTDWREIAEFASGWAFPSGIYGNGSNDPGRFTDHIVNTARALAQEAVNHVASGIRAAVRSRRRNVLVLTHFPPFAKCVQGKKGTQGCLPWYSSRVMGQTLLGAASSRPDVKFTVLCGHAHSRWSGDLRPNLTVHVGRARYGSPEVQSTIDVD